MTAVLFPRISTGIDRNGPSFRTQMGQEKRNYWKMIVMRLPVRSSVESVAAFERERERERETSFIASINNPENLEIEF